jgi:hypothetical protein
MCIIKWGEVHTLYPCALLCVIEVCKAKSNVHSFSKMVLPGTLKQHGLHRKKKVREFPVPSRDVTTKLSLGGNNDVITEFFLPRGVSDISAGDGKLVNLFLRCSLQRYLVGEAVDHRVDETGGPAKDVGDEVENTVLRRRHWVHY